MNKPKSTEPTSTGKALTYRVAFTVLALLLFVCANAQVKIGVRQKLDTSKHWKELRPMDSVIVFKRYHPACGIVVDPLHKTKDIKR